MASLRDLCLSIGSGATPSRKNPDFYTGDIRWLKTKELRDAAVFDTEEKITGEALDKSSCKLLPEGTVVMAMYGATVGKLGLLGREMTTNQACCAMVVNPDLLDNRYLFYWLKNNRGQIQDLSNGAAQQNLSVGTIGALEVAAPPVHEQFCIASVLGSLDDKIAANQATISLSTQMIRAIASLPENRVPLNALAVRNTRSVNPNKLGDSLVIHHSIPSFDLGFPAVEPADSIKSNKMHVERPSVLVSKLNPRTPRVWSIPDPKQQPMSLASTEFVVLEPVDISQSQLYAATLHASFHHQLASLVGGTSNSHQRVKPEEMLDCFVPDVRGLNEAQITLLDTLVQIKEQSIQENVTLAKTRDELLPLLMSGKISVREAEQEATSAGADIPSEGIGA